MKAYKVVMTKKYRPVVTVLTVAACTPVVAIAKACKAVSGVTYETAEWTVKYLEILPEFVE